MMTFLNILVTDKYQIREFPLLRTPEHGWCCLFDIYRFFGVVKPPLPSCIATIGLLEYTEVLPFFKWTSLAIAQIKQHLHHNLLNAMK